MTFFLDHDVPEETARVLEAKGHEVVRLRTVLPITATDAEAFAYAGRNNLFVVTCNRTHFLDLASQEMNPGLIILFRRNSRSIEAACLLRLLENAGADGLRGNINFA